MTKKELRELLRDMGADTAQGMLDALEDGAVLEQIAPADTTDRAFQLVVEDLHAEIAAAMRLGHKGGSAKSEAKTRAVRENGRRGGRPAARH